MATIRNADDMTSSDNEGHPPVIGVADAGEYNASSGPGSFTEVQWFYLYANDILSNSFAKGLGYFNVRHTRLVYCPRIDGRRGPHSTLAHTTFRYAPSGVSARKGWSGPAPVTRKTWSVLPAARAARAAVCTNVD